MQLNDIMNLLKSRMGSNFDATRFNELFRGQDMSKLSFPEIMQKLKSGGLVGDLDGDGVQESLFEELKGKFGSLFGRK